MLVCLRRAARRILIWDRRSCQVTPRERTSDRGRLTSVGGAGASAAVSTLAK